MASINTTNAVIKIDQTLVFKTDYRLMQIERNAECRMLQEGILQYFRPALSDSLSVRPSFCLFLVATQDMFYCMIMIKLNWNDCTSLWLTLKQLNEQRHIFVCYAYTQRPLNVSLALRFSAELAILPEIDVNVHVDA